MIVKKTKRRIEYVRLLSGREDHDTSDWFCFVRTSWQHRFAILSFADPFLEAAGVIFSDLGALMITKINPINPTPQPMISNSAVRVANNLVL